MQDKSFEYTGLSQLLTILFKKAYLRLCYSIVALMPCQVSQGIMMVVVVMVVVVGFENTASAPEVYSYIEYIASITLNIDHVATSYICSLLPHQARFLFRP